jgi:transposase InsO family protein
MDVKLAAALADDHVNVREFCRRHGISPSTFYKWRTRFKVDGLDGLQELSRRPNRSPSLLSADVEDAIVAARKQLDDDGWDAGPDSVLDRLARDGIAVVPSRATIWRVLRRRGLIVEQPKKRPKSSWRRFEWSRPNECWQIDATHWTLTNDTVAEIINIIDDHSRVLTNSMAVPVTTSAAAWKALIHGAQQWGLPGHVLSDNGLAFTASRQARNPVAFAANLHTLGIRTITSTPFHPQTCGKVERFHQTLKLWLDRHPAHSIRQLQALLDEFAEHYNHTRPHRACSRQPPITKWQASPPAGPAEHPIDAPTTINTVRVDPHGGATAAGYTIALGNTWTGEHVTVVTQAGHAAVFHHHTLVRQLDLDPNQRYQRLYQTDGRPPASVRDVSRQNRPR